MVQRDMAYALRCDTCDFDHTVDAESRAYALARDHEAEEGGHFVLIESEQ